MSWKREKEAEGQVAGAEGQVAGEEAAVAEEVAVVVVAPPHQAQALALALDHHRGVRGLGQEVEVEAEAEVEVVDAQCKPETSIPISSLCYFSLTKSFLPTEVLLTEVADTTAEAQQVHTNPEVDHQVESCPLPLAPVFSALH